MPDIQHDPRPQCGRPPAPYKILHGWCPCRCGGHRTRTCREDAGGCGHELYVPPLDEETCTPVPQGFTAPRG